VSAATGLEFVSNMVSNWLSSSDYNVVIRYRPKSELTSDEVDFGLSKSLINNRLFVEVEGNYLIDNKQAVNSSMSNFMGEAYITYLIDRAGTLKLKAFTQTIVRFDENRVCRRPASASTSRRISTTCATCGSGSRSVLRTRSARRGASPAVRPARPKRRPKMRNGTVCANRRIRFRRSDTLKRKRMNRR